MTKLKITKGSSNIFEDLGFDLQEGGCQIFCVNGVKSHC